MPYVINSHPDAPDKDQHTQLEIDDAFRTLTVRYVRGGRAQDVLTAALGYLFAVRFSRFDLSAQRMSYGYVEYNPGPRPPAVASYDPGNGIELVYEAPGAVVIPRPKPALPPGVADVTVAPDAEGTIRVTVSIKAAGNAARPSNHGWINFDIRHDFPAFMPARSSSVGWEESLYYPILTDVRPAAQGAALESVVPPMQFAGLYTKTDSPDGPNAAVGVCVHVEDERGHAKTAGYDPDGRVFAFSLRNSIHLAGRDFVRAPAYALSGGDDYGFGGNRAVYRLRAFRLEGACAGAPVGWHDVLDIYRRWLRARYSGDASTLFYDKLPAARARPRNAPADEMSPHTVITNYGLDGQVDAPPRDLPLLNRWLEIHPLRDKYPDVAGNTNASVADVLGRMKAKFPAPFKLEAQIWGYERAGFYQFLGGMPPLCVTVTGAPQKFANGVQDLIDEGVVTSITTDPLNTIFNRARYGGHLRWKGRDWGQIADPATWEAFITQKFPAAFNASDCPVSVTKIGGKQFDRVWVVEHFPSIERAPNCPEADALRRNQKTDEFGRPRQELPVIATGFYRAAGKQICPTAETAALYLNGWARPRLIEQGVRVVEFMKHGPHAYFCYRAEHQHVVAHPSAPAPAPNDPPVPPAPDAPYTNVIGHGSWYVRRVQAIYHDLHEAGKRFDQDAASSFRLSQEFTPPEQLAPYVDEYYWMDERFHFVYSQLCTPHMSLGRDFEIHPGYREERKSPGPRPVPPSYMLDAARDREPIPVAYREGMTAAERKAALDAVEADPAKKEALAKSYRAWRSFCVGYFDSNFRVAEYGVAPRSYPVGPKRPNQPEAAWNPAKPLAPTNPPTYTYNRCAQDVFNLRAQMFETAARAVLGERVMIPSVWLEEPLDYNDEAVNVAVRAALMQMRFRDYFRAGLMLGETRVAVDGRPHGRPPKEVWAWGDPAINPRGFDDVAPLVAKIGEDDPYFGDAWRTRPFVDFISKGWDKQAFNDIVVYRQVRHRVWQHGEGDARKVLYVFANLGNAAARVQFLYGRGLEGVTQAAGWRRTVNVFGPAPVRPAAGPVWCGMTEDALNIPARSFAAVEAHR